MYQLIAPVTALVAVAVIVPAGAITVTTSATNTGAIVWSITYFPYDAGATVVAL